MPGRIDNAMVTDHSPLRSVQPTELWTFEDVYSHYVTGGWASLQKVLDEFLLLNREVILDPSPFKTSESESTLKDDVKEFSLRSVLYSGVTPSRVKDASKIAKVLRLDQKEILRIIVQINKKIPTTEVYDVKKKNSKLPDDIEKFMENEKFLMYCKRILLERRIVLKLAKHLIRCSNSDSASLVEFNLYKELLLSQDYLTKAVDALSELAQILISRNNEYGFPETIVNFIFEEQSLFISDILEVFSFYLSEGFNKNKDLMIKWFKLMDSYNFGSDLGPSIGDQELLSKIKGLITIVSVQLLDLDKDVNTLNPDHYFNDIHLFKELNQIMTNPLNSNAIVMYTWAIILLRKRYLIDVSNALPDPANASADYLSIFELDESINMLVYKSDKLDVFRQLCDLEKATFADMTYYDLVALIVFHALPLINVNPNISFAINKIFENLGGEEQEKVFSNEFFQNAVILSRAKFPIEISPYVNLIAIDEIFAFMELSELKSYASVFKKAKFENMYEVDDENTSLVKLNRAIDIYPPYELGQRLSLHLDEGTKAKILPSSVEDEVIVVFLYKFNGWTLLGRVLQNVSKLFDASDKNKTNLILGILNAMSVVVEGSAEKLDEMLDWMSKYTDDSGIIEVLLRLSEQALHARHLKVLVSLLEFLDWYGSTKGYSRIWLYLSKSALLSNEGKEGLALSIFSAIETVNGNYDFTISLLKLFGALVSGIGEPDDEVKSSVLSRIIYHSLLVFESSIRCMFNRLAQKLELMEIITGIFSDVIKLFQNMELGGQVKSKKVKDMCRPPFDVIKKSFLLTSLDTSRAVIPLLAFMDMLASDERDLIQDYWKVHLLFEFSTLLVNVRSLSGLRPSAFEKALFQKLPKLVTIYTQNEVLREDVMLLLTALSNGIWKEEKVPSILSHLGEDYARILLHSLASDLSNSITSFQLRIAIYNFICSTLDASQEGISTLFINGINTFGSVSSSIKKNPVLTDLVSLLSVLKKNLRDVEYVPYVVSVRLVNAISLAYNSYITWRQDNKEDDFTNEIISTVQLIHSRDPKSVPITEHSEINLTARLYEILSLLLFTSKSKNAQKLILDFVVSDEFFSKQKEHFAMNKTASTTLTKREMSQYEPDQWPPQYSVNYEVFRDTDYENAQLSVAKAGGALLAAFCRRSPATVDGKFLDLVQHILALNSSDGLESEISSVRLELAFYIMYMYFKNRRSKDETKKLFGIIKVCSELLSSSKVNFLDILASGGDSAHVITLKILFCCLSLIKDESGLLIEYFSVFRNLFDFVIAKGLRTLILVLQNEVFANENNDKLVVSLNISTKTNDLLLILSILKVYMGMKLPSHLETELAKIVSDNNTVKSLLNFYSFSHLAITDGEPFLAQLSLMFIQQLLINEVICGQFIREGLFMVIVKSPISIHIRQGGVNAIDSPQFHKIWTNGLLPIFLTILTKLGGRVLPEVCRVILLFGKQIELCIESWSRDSSSIRISTATVAETSQILLLYQVLKSLNATDYLQASAGIPRTDISDIGPDSVDMSIMPGLESETKREEFVNYINNLLKHPKFLASRVSPSSLDEQRILESRGPSLEGFLTNIVDEIRDLKDLLTN